MQGQRAAMKEWGDGWNQEYMMRNPQKNQSKEVSKEIPILYVKQHRLVNIQQPKTFLLLYQLHIFYMFSFTEFDANNQVFIPIL